MYKLPLVHTCTKISNVSTGLLQIFSSVHTERTELHIQEVHNTARVYGVIICCFYMPFLIMFHKHQNSACTIYIPHYGESRLKLGGGIINGLLYKVKKKYVPKCALILNHSVTYFKFVSAVCLHQLCCI